MRWLQSFVYAWQGLKVAFRDQRNLRVHGVAAIAVVILGVYFAITSAEWCILALTMTLVISLELVNTAIERLTDLASPGYEPVAGKVKDIAAAAVLFASVGAAVIGVIIFVPYFFAI